MKHQKKHKICAAITALLVFSIAILLRAPSCYESFWLDELHSAWCIWGSFGDVGARAKAGHQMPAYFWTLWCWKQLFGGSEFALRMSSVIAVSASCGLLTYLTATRFKSLAGGFTAGMILSIEQNSLFFGTELRPYGCILFTTTIAVFCFASLLDDTNNNDLQSSRKNWLTLLCVVATGFLLQPTSLGTLIVFPIILIAIGKKPFDPNRKKATTVSRVAYGLLICVTIGGLISRTNLLDAWEQRELWSAFGKSYLIGEIAYIWNWTCLWILPLTALTFLLLSFGCKKAWKQNQNLLTIIAYLAMLCILITGIYWVISWNPIIPLWHRRYFIGVLPIFACLAGFSIVFAERILNASKQSRSVYQIMVHPALICFFIIGTLAWNQGLVQTIGNYPTAYAKRGERWREAVKYINRIASDDDAIWVAPGLIEEKLYRQAQRGTLTQNQHDVQIPIEDYLLYAVHGPYKLAYAAKIWTGQLSQLEPSGRNILLARTPASRLDATLKKSNLVTTFGGLSVIVFDEKR